MTFQKRIAADNRRAQQTLEVAGILSRVVGSVRAVECARNAVAATVDGYTSLFVATVAAIDHRRKHAAAYGTEWATVTDRQADECAAAVRLAMREEAHALSAPVGTRRSQLERP